MTKDIYSEITNRIIEELEQGIIPWNKPWTGVSAGAISHTTGRPYSILNQMLLQKPGEYITFNQCKKAGGSVKKGAKAKFVVFWKFMCKAKADENGDPVIGDDGTPELETYGILKYYNVFHIDDCEGISPKWDKEPAKIADVDENAEDVFTGYLHREGIRFEQEKSDKAYYSPSSDYIHLPLREQFENTAEYYSTAFHEATHSTGHVSRLNRFEAGAAAAAFGSESYSKEELVAEIGSACIINELGLETQSSFKNSAAYIQSWIRALKNDKRMIVSAAAKAEKAVKMILNIQAESEE